MGNQNDLFEGLAMTGAEHALKPAAAKGGSPAPNQGAGTRVEKGDPLGSAALLDASNGGGLGEAAALNAKNGGNVGRIARPGAKDGGKVEGASLLGTADGGNVVGGGGGGGEPPAFAPLAGDFGDTLPLAKYAALQYLQYAVSTVKDRALPRVADGQKPVQARILYAMWEMNGRAGTPRKKSARVVGDVLGKFHPHGDASVYDAMVRIAQNFSLRYPLVDGEGNFGSRDGDEPAAMRYTEARLTKFAEVLLAELDSGTVDFAPNYDGSMVEPQLLPARLPVVLLNGASGIAVGMATEIPSHNLTEVANAAIALVRDPELTLAGVMKYVKGPDFPGGGQIITPRAEMREAYANGRGSVRVRARWTIERLARGQWQVVVHELPPGASSRKVLEEIEAITNPQAKPGKKSLTPEQQREKQLMLAMLDRARDESDRTHPVRLVFEPKSSRQDESEFIKLLLAKTSMETNASINLVMVGLDGRPTGKNLKEILVEWLQFRFVTVTRRSRFRLDQVLDRIHVLEGRLLVLLNVDKVIKLIRNSDDPKPDLMRAFKLTGRQAEDILEIRLRQLAKLEHIRLEKELDGLTREQKGLEKVLGSRKALEALVIEEIEADIKAFGDKRRTVIEESEKAVLETPVLDEPLTVIFSKNGWVRARQGNGVDPASLSFKEGDGLAALLPCRTVDPVIFLDSGGRAYSVDAGSLPSARGDGAPASSLVDVQGGAKIVHCVAGKPELKVLVASSGGYGFVCTIGDMVSNRRAGREFMSVEAGESPLEPCLYDEAVGNHVVALSGEGRLLAFDITEMRAMSRGRGVIVMGLDQGEKLLAAVVTRLSSVTVRGVGRGGKEKVLEIKGEKLRHHVGHRARMGRVLPEKLQPTALAVPARLELEPNGRNGP